MENPNLNETQPTESENTDSLAGDFQSLETPAAPEVTQPTALSGETGAAPTSVSSAPEPEGQHTPDKLQRPARSRRLLTGFLWGLVIVIVFLLIVIAGGYLGYQRGIAQRTGYEATQVALAIGDQYELGLQDMANGQYEIARQRFDYVIQIDPGYPGVTDKLAEVLLVLNATATPTPIPTATVTPEAALPTPTPDARGQEELFVHAQNLIAEKNWPEAILTLESLRKADPEYQAIDVDGMFFVAYRNLGAENIGAGNLEQGIYDLNNAERFGILDTQANGYRTWARYYITGASFWGVDWGQAVFYFEQVAPQYPNMHDGTGWTASQRYTEAVIAYAKALETAQNWCKSETYYDLAYQLTGNELYADKAAEVADICR